MHKNISTQKKSTQNSHNNLTTEKLRCKVTYPLNINRSGPTSAVNTTSTLDSQPSIERLRIMARNSSVPLRSQASTKRKTKSKVVDASLKRRARLLITNSSIPKQTRNLIQYALEISDPYLAQVVRRVEGGEMTIEHLHRE